MNLFESVHGRRPKRYLINSSDMVPAWVRFRSKVQAVSRSKATHYLVDIWPASKASQYTQDITAEVAVRADTYAARVVLIRLGDDYGVYAHIDTNATLLSSGFRRAASAVYSRVEGICYNTPTVMDTLYNIFAPAQETRPKRFKGLRQYENSKVTAQHHTHLTPDELLTVAEQLGGRRKYYFHVMVERLAESNIVVKSTVSSLLLYVLTLSERFVPLVLDSRAIWGDCKSEHDLNDNLKNVSGQVKSIHSADYEPLTELFELAVLMNRGIGNVDWKQERRNREDPDAVNIEPADIYKVTRDLFEDTKSEYKYPYMTMDDYLSGRWEWVPGGSVHSQYQEDQDYIIPGQYSRNKFITVNMMPKQAIQRMFSSKPEIRAWTSTKYEWGKQRAIYGTDLRSTLITNFAMFRCEDVLKHKFPVGEQAEANRVHKRINMMLADAGSFCFDYDDFNSQHSIANMYAVLLAFRDTFKRNMSQEQLKAMDWVCESVQHMYALDPSTDEWYQLRGTLLSGWRLTTFMNTVLNWAYMKVAGVFDHSDVKDSVHNGDDVMISLNKVSTAVHIMHRMHTVNARAQEAKCNLFSISEFLRVEHGMKGGDGLGAQYLSRSCATAVHSRIESNEPISITRLLEADQTRMRDLYNRTGEKRTVELVHAQLKARAAKIFEVDMAVVEDICRLHRVSGGINTGRWADIDKRVVADTSAYQIPYKVDDPSLWPGVNDYVRRIWTTLDEKVPMHRVKDAVVRGSRLTIAVKRGAKISTVDDVASRQARSWERAMYKAYRGIAVTYYTSLSKFLAIAPMFNIEYGDARYAIDAATGSSDPLRALQIML